MFKRNCTITNFISIGVAVINIFQPLDSGNGSSVSEAQQPSRGRSGSRFGAVLTTHGEVTQELGDTNTVFTAHVSVLLDDLTIALANFCRNLNVPDIAGERSFQSIGQPGKTRMGIYEYGLRNTDCGFSTFGNCVHCNGQITQAMQVANLLFAICAMAQRITNAVIVLGHNFLFTAVEEVVVEGIDQDGLTIALAAPINNAINIIQSAHTRSTGRINAGKTLGILLCVSCLIKVDQNKRIIHCINFLSFFLRCGYAYFPTC